MKANRKDLHDSGRPLTKEEFISRIKEDKAFSEKWGDLGPIYGKQWRNWEILPDQYSYGDYIKGSEENRESLKRWIKLNPELLVSPEVTLTEEQFINRIKNDKKFAERYKNPIYNSKDQIIEILNLLKTDPDSRRILVSAWNPGELDQMVLPPCHYSFQLYTRELKLTERLALAFKKLTAGKKEFTPMDYANEEAIEPLNIPRRAISLMWNQRSVDSFLGLPFNIASYALLLCIIAKEVNMEPDELIGNLGDTHIYTNHMDQVKEQLKREPHELPQLDIKLHFENKPSFVPEYWLVEDFQIEGYQYHPAIKAPLSN